MEVISLFSLICKYINLLTTVGRSVSSCHLNYVCLYSEIIRCLLAMAARLPKANVAFFSFF